MSRIAQTLSRLHGEQGVAAIVCVGVVAVLGLASASAVAYSTTNSGSASRSLSDQIAFALAEAALNNAAAVISNPQSDASDPNLLPGASQEYEQGTATWSGTLDEAAGVWTVVGIGIARNPTGPSASPVRRRLTMKIPIVVASPPTQALANGIWNWIVATRTGNTCDMTLSSDVALDSRLYVAGNLCFSSGARYTGGSLAVARRLTLNATDNYVGTSSAPLADAHVGIGCKYGKQHAHPDASHASHPFCSSADNVYARTLDQALPSLTLPAPDWNGWYENAAPGPRNACTSASGPVPTFDNNGIRDKSVTTVANLTPTSSYSCVAGSSELSWNATTRVLTIRGTVFIDGSAKIDNAGVSTYEGHGTIYLSGSFIAASSNRLCAVAAGSECDTAAWDPNERLVAIVADGNGDGGAFSGNGIEIGSYARFQGALWATHNIQFGTSSGAHGPMIASTIVTCAGMKMVPFPLLHTVPSGLPGQPLGSSKPGSPTEFSG